VQGTKTRPRRTDLKVKNSTPFFCIFEKDEMKVEFTEKCIMFTCSFVYNVNSECLSGGWLTATQSTLFLNI
jgi:hypothetical protein